MTRTTERIKHARLKPVWRKCEKTTCYTVSDREQRDQDWKHGQPRK